MTTKTAFKWFSAFREDFQTMLKYVMCSQPYWMLNPHNKVVMISHEQFGINQLISFLGETFIHFSTRSHVELCNTVASILDVGWK